MLMNVDVRDELKKIVDAIGAGGTSAARVPEVSELFRTFDEIPALRDKLIAKLQALLNAIDGGQRPELAGISNLPQPVMKALQELQAPGGPPGIGDNLR
jgi:hypothetical protein